MNELETTTSKRHITFHWQCESIIFRMIYGRQKVTGMLLTVAEIAYLTIPDWKHCKRQH